MRHLSSHPTRPFVLAFTCGAALSSGCTGTASDDWVASGQVWLATTTFEAEGLARSSSAIGTNVVSDTKASGGGYVQLNTGSGVNDWIQFTLPGLAAGTYSLTMYFKSNTNRGIHQASLDGTNLGPPCDEYRTSAQYQLACSLGTATVAAGNHALRFTVTGKSAASSGTTMTIDKIVLASSDSGTGGAGAGPGAGGSVGSGGAFGAGGVVASGGAVGAGGVVGSGGVVASGGMLGSGGTPSTPISFEAESLARSSSAIGTNVVSDAKASGGGYVQLNTGSGVNDWIQFTLPGLAAGTYSLTMYFKSNTNRGIHQASLDGTNLGPPCDEYRTSAQYQLACSLGTATVAAGNHALRFTVTGKNAASSGTTMTIDRLVLTPLGSGAGGAVGTGGTQGAGGASGRGGAGGTAGVSGVLCTGNPPWTTGTPDDTLTVDTAQRGATWSRFYEQGVASDHANTVLSTAWGRNLQGALAKGHSQAGFKYVRFHGILNRDINVYRESNGVPYYDWTRFDAVYDAVVAAGMRPVVEISFTPPALATSDASSCRLHWYNNAPANKCPPRSWTIWENFMTAIVTHLEQRYGASEVRNNWYFEVWNESSWMYSLGMAGYNELFGHTARGLYAGDPLVKVGGPAESSAGSASGIQSLVSYCRSNNIKLDFVTYHIYSTDSGGSNANTAKTVGFHNSITSTIRATGFGGEILDTEFGPSAQPNAIRDSEVTASYLAKTLHLLGTNANPPVMFAYWTLSDLYEEIDTGSALAYREGGNYGLLLKGDPAITASADVAKPGFNAYRLLHMMGDVRLSATGGTTSNGVGVAATQSSDGSALQILVYNHVDGGAASSSSSRRVTVNVNNIPFAPGAMRVRHYMVDLNHSNSYTTWKNMGRPTRPSQTQWTQLRDAAEICYYETTANLSGKSWTVTYPQNTYGVSLITLSP